MKNAISIGSIVPLIEAKDNGTKYRAIIIKAGITTEANAEATIGGRVIRIKKNYPENVLIEADNKRMFEGLPVIFRSEQSHLQGVDANAENIVGYTTDTKYDTELKAIVGTLNIRQGNPLAENFKSVIHKLFDTTKQVGLSIFGYGKWVVEKINNEFVATVQNIEELISVDPCEYGNAGGRLVELIESTEGSDIFNSLFNIFSNQKNNAMKLNAAQKKALFDLLVTNKKVPDGAKIETYTDDQMLDLVSAKEIAGILTVEEPTPQPFSPERKKALFDLLISNKKIKEDAKIKEFTDDKLLELVDLKIEPNPEPGKGLTPEQVKEAEKVIAEAREILNENKFNKILAESKLPEIAKSKIINRYKSIKYKFDEATLKTELKDTAEILAESAGGYPPNSEKIKIGNETYDKYQLGLDYLMMSDGAKQKLTPEERKVFAEAGVNKLYSIRRFYSEITGDIDIDGKYSKQKLAESISASTFTEMLGIAMHRSMVKEFQMSMYNQDWRKICTVVPRIDYKENTLISMGGYGDIPIVAERGPYTAATTPEEEAVKYSMSKRGYTEDISREALLNDDLRLFGKIPVKFGRASARTLYKFIFNRFLVNPTMLYDSVALFHANHSNLMNSALDKISIAGARQKMMKQTEQGSDEPLGIIPRFLIVPVDLQQKAYELTVPGYGMQNPVPEFVQTFGLEPLIVPHITDVNDWFLLADPNENPMIEIAFLNGKQEPELLIQDMPTVGAVFSNDVITFKLRHEYSGTVENHRGFLKSDVVGP